MAASYDAVTPAEHMPRTNPSPRSGRAKGRDSGFTSHLPRVEPPFFFFPDVFAGGPIMMAPGTSPLRLPRIRPSSPSCRIVPRGTPPLVMAAHRGHPAPIPLLFNPSNVGALRPQQLVNPRSPIWVSASEPRRGRADSPPDLLLPCRCPPPARAQPRAPPGTVDLHRFLFLSLSYRGDQALVRVAV